MILLIINSYLFYERISYLKIYYWSNQDQILLSLRNRRRLSLLQKVVFLPTPQFCIHFRWMLMEMVGLHVYSILDTKVLLVLNHCDCSKTAFRFRLQKMFYYAEQQEVKNKGAFPSHMTELLLLEVVYSKSYFNAQLLCGMKQRF